MEILQTSICWTAVPNILLRKNNAQGEKVLHFESNNGHFHIVDSYIHFFKDEQPGMWSNNKERGSIFCFSTATIQIQKHHTITLHFDCIC